MPFGLFGVRTSADRARGSRCRIRQDVGSVSPPSPGGVVQIRRIRSVVSKRGHPESPVAAKAMKALRIAAESPAKSGGISGPMLDERLVDQLTTLAEPRDAESTVREVLRSMIPGAAIAAAEPRPDDNWRIQVMAWLAVVNRAARNPEMSARLSAGSDRLAAAIAAALPATATGQPGDDALRTARGLLSLVEGLLLQLARGDIDPAKPPR
ncbi:TetR family transcriptional regulator C-terminal domain-containing protein [Nocardia sp. AB354]|uniref:TetR family transcriptional regulator C-terminal domain-containing protein n=1 Tax=Nocardia sp. AB354 TaxID=3413283 RepID=UPI003C18F274